MCYEATVQYNKYSVHRTTIWSIAISHNNTLVGISVYLDVLSRLDPFPNDASNNVRPHPFSSFNLQQQREPCRCCSLAHIWNFRRVLSALPLVRLTIVDLCKTHTHAYTYMNTCTHLQTHTYTPRHTYTHLDTRTHTHTPNRRHTLICT